LLLALKETAGVPGPPLVLTAGSPPAVLLRPVATRPEHIRAADAAALTAWRNKFVQAFLTEFDATPEQTTRWLTQVVGPHAGKILFMLDDPAGRTFAYMGLDFIDWEKSTGEADAIVRGGEAAAGTMKLALETLLTWAKGALGLRTLGVRFRSDNTALVFYRKVGFVEQWREPLRHAREGNMIRWVPDAGVTNPQVELVHMLWSPGAG
jgi:hypothetical protein